jgi:hypothetical protein
MRSFLLASAMLLAVTTSLQADIFIPAPFACVRVGRDVEVSAPFVHVRVPSKKSVIPQPAEPGVEMLHPPRPADGSPVAPAAVAISHADFARGFTPAAGNYEVDLIHPYTCCPVRVCFTLPPGCPKKVRVHRGELEFDYGRTEVEIRFKKDGRVKVEYRG